MPPAREAAELVRAWRKERAELAAAVCECPKAWCSAKALNRRAIANRSQIAGREAPDQRKQRCTFEVHQLSVATCQSAAGRESIFGECRSRAAWAPIDKIRPV